MNKNYIIIFLTCLMFFAGCQKESQSRYYIMHPDEFKQVLEKCAQNTAADNLIIPECNAAIGLYKRMVVLTNQLVANPQEFGRRILQLQIDIAKMQTQISDARKNKNEKLLIDLNEKLKKLEIQLDLMLALVAATESPGG